MRKLIILVVFSVLLAATGKFDDIDIVYVNGMHADSMKAVTSAKILSEAIGYEEGKVQSIYNINRGYWADFLEAVHNMKYDMSDGGENFTQFWQTFTKGKKAPSEDVKRMHIRFLKEWYDKYGGDFNLIRNKIRDIRSANNKSNKKLLILSHSDGSAISNMIIEKFMQENLYNAKECIKQVAIAPIVSDPPNIRNSGLYTSSDKDLVLFSFRDSYNILPHNINTVVDFANDSFGHGLKEIYLNRGTGNLRVSYNGTKSYYRPHENIRNKIISDINAMADEINEECYPRYKCMSVDVYRQMLTKKLLVEKIKKHFYFLNGDYNTANGTNIIKINSGVVKLYSTKNQSTGIDYVGGGQSFYTRDKHLYFSNPNWIFNGLDVTELYNLYKKSLCKKDMTGYTASSIYHFKSDYYISETGNTATMHHYRVTYKKTGNPDVLYTYYNAWGEMYDEDVPYYPELNRELPFSTEGVPSEDAGFTAWDNFYRNGFLNNVPDELSDMSQKLYLRGRGFIEFLHGVDLSATSASTKQYKVVGNQDSNNNDTVELNGRIKIKQH